MSAKKTVALSRKHRTNADKKERIEREALSRPIAEITLDPPEELTGHDYAGNVWRELIRLYEETEGELVTAFDKNHLVHYCILSEQIAELDVLRAAAFQSFLDLSKPKRGKRKADEDAGSLGFIADKIISIDARVDRKRALLMSHANYLYLTPKARAGAVPAKKAPPIPQDEMDEILGSL